MRASIVLILLMTKGLYAAPLPLPSSILSIDTMIKTFRTVLEDKARKLSENYIQTGSEDFLTFTSTESVWCKDRTYQAGETLAQLRRVNSKIPKGIREVVFYYGCGGKLTYTETIITHGKDLKYNTRANFIKAKRSFPLTDKENLKIYSLKDHNSVELFSMVGRKDDKKNTFYKFSIKSEQFLTINSFDHAALTQVSFVFHPYSVSYEGNSISRQWGNWGLKANIFKSPKGRIDYIGYNSPELSQNSFNQVLNTYIIEKTIKKVEDFVENHISDFPSTQSSAPVDQNGRFLQELKLMYTLLLSGENLIEVKNMVLGYIEAIETKKLEYTDNREH
ncbi:MAG: hypothetical protein HOE90_18370 [Bacteriovoracaceae bacterium]|jgi:hypothetical protein|nr:hypothetical protein [Bacteriovoracaceae bacterium]